MDSQNINASEKIEVDIARAREIYTAMERGNTGPLEGLFAEVFSIFVNMAERWVFEGVESIDAVQSFIKDVLLKGNIFHLYQGENNCRLQSFLLQALRKHIHTLNAKERKRRSLEIATDPATLSLASPESPTLPPSLARRHAAKNGQVRKYVYELLRAAIARKAAKIRLSFSEASGLTILLLVDGQEEEYVAIPQTEEHIPQVLPRLKCIAGLRSDSKDPQTGSFSLTIASRIVFMHFASRTGADGCETMEISLSGPGREDAVPQLAAQSPAATQSGNIGVNAEDGYGDDGDDGGSQVTSPGEDDRVRHLDGFLEAVGWHTANEDDDNGPVGFSGGIKPAGPSPIVVSLEKREATRRYVEIVKEALARLEATHPVDARLIRLRMDEDNGFMDIAIELETDQAVRKSYVEVKRILDEFGEKSIKNGQYRHMKNALAALEKRADTLKHQYVRKDGPSALFRFRVMVERLLVERNMQLDRPARPGKQLDDRQLHKLLAEAIGRMRAQGEESTANLAEMQLGLLRAPDIALLLGTIDGRKITKSREKTSELKKLQDVLSGILAEKGCELTSLDGCPTIVQSEKKVEDSVPGAEKKATDQAWDETRPSRKKQPGLAAKNPAGGKRK